jgi:hypothetical protein
MKKKNNMSTMVTLMIQTTIDHNEDNYMTKLNSILSDLEKQGFSVSVESEEEESEEDC